MGVLVLGMHRSGTSALASALEAFGLDVGRTEELMAADRANPLGYYELRDVAELNDEILRHLGGAWHCPPLLGSPSGDDSAVPGYLSRISELIDSRFETQNFLLKDPRISILLPIWRRALLDRFSAILIVRNAAEVAWSLYLRDGIPTHTALALWCYYNRMALAGLEGLPIHVCSYEELVQQPLQTLLTIAESLADWGELGNGADLDAACSRIQPSLRRDTWPRFRAELVDLPSEVSELQKTFAELTGPHSRFSSYDAPITEWESSLFYERRHAWELEQRLASTAQELHAVQGHLRYAEEHLAVLDERLIEKGRRLDETASRVNDLAEQACEAETLLDQAMAREADLTVWKDRWDSLERRFSVRLFRSYQRFAIGIARQTVVLVRTVKRGFVHPRKAPSAPSATLSMDRVAPILLTLSAAGIDASLTRLLLMPLMIVGPLSAGVLSPPRVVALVAVLAALIAVPLGWPDHIFGSAEQFWIIGAILLAAVPSVLLSRWRHRHPGVQ